MSHCSKTLFKDLFRLSSIVSAFSDLTCLYIILPCSLTILMTILVINSQVILIEPYFDCYVPQISVAGGIPKFVPLRPVST